MDIPSISCISNSGRVFCVRTFKIHNKAQWKMVQYNAASSYIAVDINSVRTKMDLRHVDKNGIKSRENKRSVIVPKIRLIYFVINRFP